MKLPFLVTGAFVFFILGISNVWFKIQETIKVSYVVDRSISSQFVSDNEIINWIKNDVKTRKVDSFNIISFGCNFNQTVTFTSPEADFFIPKVNKSLCSNLQNVFDYANLFNNVVVISDMRFNYKDDVSKSNVEFVKMKDSGYDTLKIVSWQIPKFVLDNTKISAVLEIAASFDGVVQIMLSYKRHTKKYYRKVLKDRNISVTLPIIVKKPYDVLKISIKSLTNDDRFLLDNVLVHNFIFTDTILTYIESDNSDMIYDKVLRNIHIAPMRKAQVLIINTRNLSKNVELMKKYNTVKHIVTFLDTFVLDNLLSYKKIEKFLPIRLARKQRNKIILLIDISGSMNFVTVDKSAIARITILSGIIEWLKLLPDFKNISIYLFSDKYKKLTFSSIEEIKNKLADIKFYGNTISISVLKEVLKNLSPGDYLYIFSDTIVKDNYAELEKIVRNIRNKKINIILFHIGNKKGKLYKVFRKFNSKIFSFSNNAPYKNIYEKIVPTERKLSYIVDKAQVFSNNSEKAIFDVTNLLNTQLKKNGRNILKTDKEPFVSYFTQGDKVNVVILKELDYFLKNNIDIKEIVDSIYGIITQKEQEFLYPYYFNGKIRISLNKNILCDVITMETNGKTAYFFKKTPYTFETDFDFPAEKEYVVNICGNIKKIKVYDRYFYNNELYFSQMHKVANDKVTDFPGYSKYKLEKVLNSENKYFILIALFLLILESMRRIIL